MRENYRTDNQAGKQCFLCIAVFFAGAAVMVIELLGTRIIAPYYGSGIYSWASLISVTLFSLSIGYWIGGHIADKKPELDMMYNVILMAGFFIFLIPLHKPYVLKFMYDFGLRLGSLLSAFILFGLPLILLGMIGPYGVKISIKDTGNAGLTTGRIYALSTVGSLAGAILTGFFLIPNIGIRKILFTTASVLFIIGISRFIARRKYVNALISAVSICSLLLLNFLNVQKPPDKDGATLIYKTDSMFGEWKVVDKGETRLLLNNGIIQSAINLKTKRSELPYTYLISYLFTHYYPEGKDALMIGLGAGTVPVQLSENKIVTDVVEIDNKLKDIAKKYFFYNQGKGDIYIEDGRFYCQNSKKKYDFVIIDSYNAEAISFHLLTLESFEQIKNILKDKGILLINFVYGIDSKQSNIIGKSILLTLKKVFSYTDTYFVVSGDNPSLETVGFALIVASKNPLTLKGDNEAFYKNEERGLREGWIQGISINKGNYFSKEEGIILTDEYTPIDSWTVESSEAIRNASFSMAYEE